MTKNKKSNTTFTYTPTQDLPALPKEIPTQWDMAGMYYQSINDPQIEKDVATTERLYKGFVKKFKGTDFATNPKTLRSALDTLNKLEMTKATSSPSRYLSLLTALDSDNDAASKKLSLLGQRLTKVGNTVLFFGLELAQTDTASQKKLLTAPELATFNYYLKGIFENAKYHLTEPEEKISRLLGDCSYGMWVEMTEKMIGRKTVTYKGKNIPLNESFNTVTSLPFTEQPKLWKLIMAEVSTLDEVAENELTAICTRKQISDELRGYKKPYSAAVIGHEDDEKSVEALVEAVSTTGFALSRKFYKLKAKLHGVDQLDYGQRNASIGEAVVIDFAQATEICRDVFYGVHREYGAIFDRLLINGQIDVYPKKGKRGGAFCAGQEGQPTQVLLNHIDTISSLETYAHEMGHAIHSERSKTQPVQYEQYSTTTAETASTLFEGLLFDAVIAQADETDKVTLLHDKLARDIATIQRQTACFNFELDMHETVRASGGITRAELSEKMNLQLSKYLGPAVTLHENDGNFFVAWPHIRAGFYVYTYTFGMLMSTIMAEKFAENNAYVSQIDKFLTAGGSANVADIFKSIGINTRKIETFNYGLTKMEKEIKLLQKLTK